MDGLKLWHLAIAFGSGCVALNLYGVLNPTAFGGIARRFPRYTPAGYPLMLLATAWFLYYVRQENVADFIAMKPFLYSLFTIVGLGACVFLRDFLPVRAVAALMLLAAKLVVDTARWVPSDWRLVLVVWAYVWVVLGMWLTISPWRARDWIQWVTETAGRTRLVSSIRVAFGLLLVLLGFTVLRSVPGQAHFAPAAPARPDPIQEHA